MRLILENVDEKHYRLLKEMAKSLNFTLKNEEEAEREYSKEFRDKIDKGLRSEAEGNGVKISIEDLWK
ncbi:hypothetical protein Pedsa_2436 [Pseudopedobacter saltans DSM 12145]|uniref:Uncharacterized protein n=1 Tax=Pseudopedobacter saltans (strain ATCC 51119 / DSM 12145 / JCM 21818 / CCUG 39354 / LMG 10337 / NBRC 100064 / NCIMB 13643) TaxID=762903 RepID=F0SER7_PSESL|nr:DUF2683 family protein [Pseudopedobacter saltans]ADY52983.1 hypothetical protein Pedsa_2436 [Pseudopedobacter saltans DSM 12145]